MSVAPKIVWTHKFTTNEMHLHRLPDGSRSGIYPFSASMLNDGRVILRGTCRGHECQKDAEQHRDWIKDRMLLQESLTINDVTYQHLPEQVEVYCWEAEDGIWTTFPISYFK